MMYFLQNEVAEFADGAVAAVTSEDEIGVGEG